MTAALKVPGLHQASGEKVVPDGTDLDIGEGTAFSLFGPDGAGKTTAVHILSTVLEPDDGQAGADCGPH